MAAKEEKEIPPQPTEDELEEQEIFRAFGIDDPDEQKSVRCGAAARVLANRRLARISKPTKEEPPKKRERGTLPW